MLEKDAKKRTNSLDLKNHIETINLNQDLEIFNYNLIVNNNSNQHPIIQHINSTNNISGYLPEPIPNFSGRTTILNNIKSIFNEKQIIILNSVSGTGKSAIANRYGWKLKDETDYIITWMESDSDLKLLNGFQKFNFQFSLQEIKKKEYLIQIVNKMILNSPKKYLFIFDNCEETTIIKDYLINMPGNAKVLITTNKEIELIKNKVGFNDKIHLITIDPFDQEETKELIGKSIGQNIEQNELETLIGLIFEYFKTELRPYILNKLIIIIKLEIDDIFGSFGNFIEQYKNNKNQMIDDLMKEDNLFELLKRYDENILNILYYSSYMDPDFIPINIFTDILKLENKSISLAVKKLRSKLLISIEEKDKIKGIKIHRSFQEEIKKYLERKKKDKFIINLSDKLEYTLTLMDTREKLVKNNIGRLDHYQNYKKIIENIYNEFKNDEKKKLIITVFANFSGDYEDYNEALNNYNESLRIKRLIFGSDEHSSIADTLNNIGMIYETLGQYDLALSNYNESLRINRLIFGSDEHSSIADTLNNIGLIYYKLGQNDLALSNYNESLRINRLIFGSDEHSSITSTLVKIELVKYLKNQYLLLLDFFNSIVPH
jgi:tetratricopeptide (TPR) repeat protein